MYSQYEEEKYILDYFANYKPSLLERATGLFKRDRVPVLLDIGCNDGKTHSNSAALILNGWQALAVEPCVVSVIEARRFYQDIGKKVTVAPCAVGLKTETKTFYEFTQHYDSSGYGYFSAFNFGNIPENEVRQLFLKTVVDVMDYQTLCTTYNQHRFDFITINTNGTEQDILAQIDLSQTKLVCIAHHGNGEAINEIVNSCAYYGLTKIIYNSEKNILIGR